MSLSFSMQAFAAMPFSRAARAVRQPAPVRPAPARGTAAGDGPTATAEYEQNLRLDEGNVARGINAATQRRVVRTVEAAPDSGGCTVCQDALEAGTRVAELPCQHRFHWSCIEPWLVKERTCPTCRREVHHKAVP
jgi:hypothetical protein